MNFLKFLKNLIIGIINLAFLLGILAIVFYFKDNSSAYEGFIQFIQGIIDMIKDFIGRFSGQ